jgi:hypothetical protein
VTTLNRKSGRFDPEYVVGSITANNTAPGGVASANSAVEIDVSDAGTCAIQVTGTHGGAKSVQVTIDGNNWISLGAANAIRNEATGASSANIAAGATGIFTVDVIGFTRLRLSAPTTGTTGQADVTLFTAENPKPRSNV